MFMFVCYQSYKITRILIIIQKVFKVFTLKYQKARKKLDVFALPRESYLFAKTHTKKFGT